MTDTQRVQEIRDILKRHDEDPEGFDAFDVLNAVCVAVDVRLEG